MSALTEPIEFGEDPTALYRLYDKAGVLLYIGITTALKKRMAKHADDQPWWHMVSRKTVVWHDARQEASRAETEAINTENPKYNIQKRSVITHPCRWAPSWSVLERDAWEAGYWIENPITGTHERRRTPENFGTFTDH